MRLLIAIQCLGTLFARLIKMKLKEVISEYYAVCQMNEKRLMQRIKITLYIALIVFDLISLLFMEKTKYPKKERGSRWFRKVVPHRTALPELNVHIRC